MTLEQAKERVLLQLMSAEIGSYMTMYAPEKTVVTISNLMRLTGFTRYGTRKACLALIDDGMIEFVSQGCPAVVSYGEVPELVWDAGSPLNGYTMTKKAFESDMWKEMYSEWCKSLEEWANENVKEAGA